MKKKRNIFDVIYKRGGWHVKERASKYLHGPYETKTQAVANGRYLARVMQPSQLVIRGRDGQIQTEHTYGQDPRRSKG